MNVVEIADAVADLAARPFEAAEFPFQFLAAFDKKALVRSRTKRFSFRHRFHSETPLRSISSCSWSAIE